MTPLASTTGCATALTGYNHSIPGTAQLLLNNIT